MPYMREGAQKVSDHWVRSPLLNVNRSCQVCHSVGENELVARVSAIQDRETEVLTALERRTELRAGSRADTIETWLDGAAADVERIRAMSREVVEQVNR